MKKYIISNKDIQSKKWLPEYDELSKLALKAKHNSYAPYSNFNVGAALLSKSGNVYTGCNVENAVYNLGICAERNAIFNAINKGERKFKLIVLVGAPHKLKGSNITVPCGSCRQVMAEFVDPDEFLIIMPKINKNNIVKDYRILTLSEMLPFSFDQHDLTNIN